MAEFERVRISAALLSQSEQKDMTFRAVERAMKIVLSEGIEPEKTFLGLELAGQRDLLMFLVAEQLSRDILETICSIGQFDDKPGSGIAFQLGIEDAVGLSSQLRAISEEIVDQL